MKTFIERNFMVFICFLLVFTFLKGCNDSSNLRSFKKEFMTNQVLEIKLRNLSEKMNNVIDENLAKEREVDEINSMNRTFMEANRQKSLTIQIQKNKEIIENYQIQIKKIEEDLKIYEILDK